MPRYAITTTVDITRANPNREDSDQVAHAQQSNFNSLIQGIGLRANVDWYFDPQKRTNENGEAEWSWEFSVERDDIFKQGDNPIALLEKDLHGVPIIGNLTNTVQIDKSVFLTKGDGQNLWIKII